MEATRGDRHGIIRVQLSRGILTQWNNVLTWYSMCTDQNTLLAWFFSLCQLWLECVLSIQHVNNRFVNGRFFWDNAGSSCDACPTRADFALLMYVDCLKINRLEDRTSLCLVKNENFLCYINVFGAAHQPTVQGSYDYSQMTSFSYLEIG